MFYYKVDGNKIFKYEVSYDLEIIKKLQKDLANDCSIEKEYTYSSVGVPRRDKNVKYKKFEYKFVDTRYDFYGDDDIYEVKPKRKFFKKKDNNKMLNEKNEKFKEDEIVVRNQILKY